MATLRRYKGVAIFGAPGSGKTTIAKLCATSFPSSRYVEASDAVIRPAFAMRERLPAKEGDFVRRFGVLPTGSVGSGISREDARAFFLYLKNRYSSSVIAKTLVHLHQRKIPKKFLIIAGIRGYRNATLLKSEGYLIVYLTAPGTHLAERVSKREEFSRLAAEREQQIEERLFSTNKIERMAHAVFNIATIARGPLLAHIHALVDVVECRKCVNVNANVSGTIGATGLCDVCEGYEKHFNPDVLKRELKRLLSWRGSGAGGHDVMVGISGGKDSTATLSEVVRMGFTPLAFTLDTHYYPKHIFPRAERVARAMDVEYERIDVKKYIRPVDRICFRKTAALYEEHDSLELKEKFRKWYFEGRRHYSVKCQHAIPFVRTCQLCRRIIVRAYYGEARKHGVGVVILGINEWAGLSQDSVSKKSVYSAVRKLQPYKHRPPVYIVHLPFLLRWTIRQTEGMLRTLGWKIPRGERLIETNANSCLFARAAESKALRMLGFHPDSTRLAREVTVGFITKQQARSALDKRHTTRSSVGQVLRKARVL